MAMYVTVLLLITERRLGILERQFINGIGSSQVVLGHLIAGLTYHIIQIMLSIAVCFSMFGIPDWDRVLLIVSLMFILNTAGKSVGLFISSISGSNFIFAITIVIGMMVF